MTILIDGVEVPVVIDDNGTARANLTNITPGKHNVTVIYVDENNNTSIVNSTIDVPRWSSAVNATAATIREGDPAIIKVKVNPDMTGEVKVVINGTGYIATIDKNGEATITAYGLKAGTHTGVVTYLGDSKYDPSNATFEVTVQEPITVEVNGTGNNSEIVVQLPKGANESNIEIFVDDKPVQVVVDENGTARANLTGIEPGQHNITVKYTDEDGTVSWVNSTITVPRWDSSVNATAATIREGDVANIIVTVGGKDMTGRVFVDINGTGYYADVEDGKAIIKAAGLKAGSYIGNVTYEGNTKYDPSNNTFKVVVQAPITIDINGTGNSSQVVVQLPENATEDMVKVLIDGKETNVTVDKNGTAVANLTGLEPGEHNITVIYTDEFGTESVVNQTITVPRWDSSVNATAKTIREGDVANIIVTVGGKDMTGRVFIDINGTGYYADVEDGKAIIKANGLKAGSYIGNVTYEGNTKYDPSNNTFKVVVEAPITIDINGTGNSSQVVIDLPENGTDNVTVVIDGKEVPVVVENGTAKANLTNLEPGEHNITVVYTDADGTQSVVNQTINVPRWDSSVNATAATIREGDVANIVVTVGGKDMTGIVFVDINGTGYYADIEDGKAIISAPGLKSGTYIGNVTYEGNSKYDPSNNTFTITVEAPIVINVDGAGNSTQVVVDLPNNGTDGNVTVLVDGQEVPVKIVNGTAVADLNNMTPGEHNVTVIYTDKDGTQSIANKTITVYNSINANDMTRGWNSPYDYESEFLDKDGHVVANTTMEFKVNGKTYTVTTDNKGIARLSSSHLAVGEYTIEITNTLTHETINRTVTIVKRIIENKDLTMDYLSGKSYVVKVIGDDGKPVGAGEVVGFRVNGVDYNGITDKNGYARLKITLAPKKYTITAQYAKYKVSNKIVIKQTLKLVKKTVTVKKTAKKLVIKAKLKWSNGKAIKGKKLVLKIKGKKYKAKTNKKGIAKFTVKKNVIKKLKKGKKYTYTVSYNKEKVKGKVKVKK